MLIHIYLNEALIAEAQNIRLEPYSTTTLRKLYFSKVKQKADEILLEHEDQVQIEIYALDKQLMYFEFELYDVNYLDLNFWTFEGFIKNNVIYRQGFIDVYNYWISGKEVQWYNLPKGISIIDYILACMNYSSLQITPKKDVFEIDFELVKSELDFACAFAEEFLGKRSYMGRYLDTFEDCLLTLYKHRGRYFEDKTIKLKHINKNEDIHSLIDEVKLILKKYRFNIIEA